MINYVMSLPIGDPASVYLNHILSKLIWCLKDLDVQSVDDFLVEAGDFALPLCKKISDHTQRLYVHVIYRSMLLIWFAVSSTQPKR